MKNGFDLSGEDNFKKFRKDFIIYPFMGGIGERNRGRSFPLTESPSYAPSGKGLSPA